MELWVVHVLGKVKEALRTSKIWAQNLTALAPLMSLFMRAIYSALVTILDKEAFDVGLRGHPPSLTSDDRFLSSTGP